MYYIGCEYIIQETKIDGCTDFLTYKHLARVYYYILNLLYMNGDVGSQGFSLENGLMKDFKCEVNATMLDRDRNISTLPNPMKPMENDRV